MHCSPEAIKTYGDLCAQYSIGPDKEVQDRALQCVKEGWVTHVSGLLFKSFQSVADKVSLRDAVLKHQGLLPKHLGLSKADFPKALRVRCEQAVVFKVAVGAA